MNLIDVINNKNNFKKIENKINKIEKNTNIIKRNGKDVIYASMLFYVFFLSFLSANSLLFSSFILLLLIPILLIIVCELNNSLDNFLFKILKITCNKKEIKLLKAFKNMKGINSIFYNKKIIKKFNKEIKNKENQSIFEKIELTYKNKVYKKDLYKDVLIYTILKNKKSDIVNNQNKLLKELNTFNNKDKKDCQMALVKKIGLENIIKEEKLIENRKEEVLKSYEI